MVSAFGTISCQCYLEDLERKGFARLVVRILFVLEVIPNLPCRCTIQVGVQMHFEWLRLRNALFFEHEKPIEKEQEIWHVTCNVECCPPVDEADVLWILLSKYHRHS